MNSKASYKQLIVWQKSVELVSQVYALTKQLPAIERYILVSQMLRAAISIASNIAEGWSRHRNLEFLRFLEIAFASSCELETQIIIAKQEYPKLNYQSIENLLLEIQKMLTSLIKKVKSA